MRFCPVCENMYYVRMLTNEDQEESLVHYCRHCGHTDNTLIEDNMCVLHTNFKKKEQKFHNFINEYTKLDPTLPRLNSMKCPNEGCPSNRGEQSREIIYIRYDDLHMKYVYLCSRCEKVWKTGDKQ